MIIKKKNLGDYHVDTPSQEVLDKIPRLYETENIPIEKKNYLHFLLVIVISLLLSLMVKTIV